MELQVCHVVTWIQSFFSSSVLRRHNHTDHQEDVYSHLHLCVCVCVCLSVPGLKLQRSLLPGHQEGPGDCNTAGLLQLDRERDRWTDRWTGLIRYRSRGRSSTK